METLFDLWPFVMFFLIVFIDKNAAKKRREERQQQREYEQQGENAETVEDYAPITFEKNREDDIPWYIEFPEDREVKKQEKIIDIAPAKEIYTEKPFMEPTVEEERKTLPTDKFDVQTAAHRKAVRKKVLQGIVMAEVLDKPRALKPYGNN